MSMSSTVVCKSALILIVSEHKIYHQNSYMNFHTLTLLIIPPKFHQGTETCNSLAELVSSEIHMDIVSKIRISIQIW